MRSLKPLLLNSTFVLLMAATAAWAGQMSGGDYVITKDLLGASGPILAPMDTSADYALAFAWGEPVSGNVTTEPTVPYTIISGYFGGSFGNGQTFKLLTSQVGATGAKTFFQDHVQVGVPFDAPITLTFSDQLNSNNLPTGLQVAIVTDHLGHSSTAFSTFTVTVDTVTNSKVTLIPQGAWLGNTLYDVQIVSPDLLSIGGFPLDQTYHIYFVTELDHRQENVVLDPIAPAGSAASDGSTASSMSIDIPQESLAGFSTVLLSRDPINSPLQVDPAIIKEANDKARASGGAYAVPISVQEITAYDTQGNLMGPLSKPAQITMDYGAGSGFGASGANSLIRPETLSFWVLDQTHRLWVKMPATANSVGLHTVTASAAYLSVFALMGSADGSASDTYVFPVPWRPHGPNAGSGPGQTGTEGDGILFSNLPSECTISIYTISGDRVRQIHHSDTNGLIAQERWDVKTTHGDEVASGVYLWRVESSVDGKNGKLMVIR